MSQETIKTYQGCDHGASQCLVTLEGFIGDVDGKTIGTEADGFFTDDGTVDASEAVTAINGLIWSLERREAELQQARQDAEDAKADALRLHGDKMAYYEAALALVHSETIKNVCGWYAEIEAFRKLLGLAGGTAPCTNPALTSTQK